MKTAYKFVILLALIFSAPAFSQGKNEVTVHKMITAGYTYQNASWGELGGKLLFLNNDDVLFRVGATAMMGAPAGKFSVLPKANADFLINFERNVDFYHSWYFLAGAEVTTKYAAPKIGLTIAGILDVTGGYAFSFDKKGINGKQLKGLNIGVTLNIPWTLITG